MKYVGALVSSLAVFIVIVANFYYNSLTLEMQKIKEYAIESNIILEDVVDKVEFVVENKKDYINRLETLKKGLNNSNTIFFINDYKKYKVKSIENLIESLDKSIDEKIHLTEVVKYNKLCDKEIDKLIISKNIVS